MTFFDDSLDFDEIEVAGARTDFDRDRWGRPLIDGVPYTRISTLADGIESKYGLHVWEKYHLALAIARCPDLRLRLQGLTYADKAELKEICAQALVRAKDHGTDPTGSLRKANIGTAVHTFVERGTTPKPSEDEPEIEAVVSVLALRERVLADAGLRVHSVSPKLVNHRLKCAGTGDDVLTDGTNFYMADTKTGRLNLKSAIVQLSGYASCELYDLETGKSEYFPFDQRRAFVQQMDVTAGTFELIEVDITANTLGGLTPIELAVAVHQHNSTGNISTRRLRTFSS